MEQRYNTREGYMAGKKKRNNKENDMLVLYLWLLELLMYLLFLY